MFDGVPLHPILVHGPLVLGILAPIVALLLWAAIAGRYLHHRVWWLAVFVHLAAFGAAIVAVETGEDEEERVEEVVEHDLIHAHGERGEAFRNALGAAFVLSLLAGFLFGSRTWGMRLAGVTVVAGFATAWLALGVGHSGGLLVYKEGAANYYVSPGVQTGPRVMRAAPGDSVETEGEDHEH